MSINVIAPLVITAGVLFIWELGMVFGWLLTRDDCPAPHPWNWRLLTGPGPYFKWLDRQGGPRVP